MNSFDVKIDLAVDEPLSSELIGFLLEFFRTTRYAYDLEKVNKVFGDSLSSPYSYFGEYGKDGEFLNISHLPESEKAINHKRYLPVDVPSRQCPFTLFNQQRLVLTITEFSFSVYKKWIEYIIKNFLETNGYFLNGYLKFTDQFNLNLYSIFVDRNVVSTSTDLSILEIKMWNV